jgi:poly-gamma-glutamate synthase PgsB/CapB
MFSFYLLFLLILLIYLAVEYIRLAKSLQRIPIRILVTGTRGKSTMVKIIHEMLRQSGQKVFAKTTGDQPLEHLSDGKTRIILRHAPASIIENISILRGWVKESPEALVMECMALQPENQRSLSTQILKPNYILISNIRLDHAEVMGHKLDEMATTILECVTKNASILTTNQVAESLRQFGKPLESICIAKPKEFLEKFANIPSQIVDQNWSLIKTLADQLKIDPSITYRSFYEIHSSMGAKVCIEIPALNYSFWNLFSINDHQSTAMFIDYSQENKNWGNQKIILFNNRSDRPLRTKYFAELVLQEFPENIPIWITGSGKRFARNVFRRKTLSPDSIILMNPKEVLDKLKSKFEMPAIIYGIGNFYGMQAIVEHLFALESQNV